MDWDVVSVIGIDLGDRISQLVALDAAGNRVGEGRIPTTPASFERRFGTLPPKLVAIETGTHSPWISRLLKRSGHQVIVANSRKLRLIYENRNKNDRVDAEYLARLARLDPKLLSPVEHRSEMAQQHLTQIHARDVLVKTRSRLIVAVRGMVKPSGERLPACSAESFVKRARPALPEQFREALEPVLISIEQVNQQIHELTRMIERLADHQYPEAARLTQVAGVGKLTAVAYIVTVGQRDRFTHSRAVGPWLGLTPGQRASGRSDPQQRITKQGDRYLRSLLVNGAHYILGPFGPDCDLKRHGLAIAARGGKNAKKRAVVAVARKLSVLLHRLWCTGAVYEPLRHASKAAVAA
jgi:transposase